MHIKKVESYYKINVLEKYEELPFCICVFDQPKIKEVLSSIENQNYSNYKILIFTDKEQM